jgi:hypothetical protein
MQVPIPVNNVYLVCSYGENDPPPTEESLASANQSTRVVHEHFDVEILPDMALDSNEKKSVSLKLYPKTEGPMKVLGIKYLLCGIIPAFSRFDNLKSKTISITVTPPMPVLECKIHNLSDELITGQVCSATLELHNKGGQGLQNLHVYASHPSFCYFGDGTKTTEISYRKLLTLNCRSRETIVHVRIKTNQRSAELYKCGSNDKNYPSDRRERAIRVRKGSNDISAMLDKSRSTGKT